MYKSFIQHILLKLTPSDSPSILFFSLYKSSMKLYLLKPAMKDEGY